MPELKPLSKYSGESAEDLFGYEGRYRTDSIVEAFEAALEAKKRLRPLASEEEIVLAVEALEREVNHGGFDQFFANKSRTYAPMIVEALARIGCWTRAEITRDAISALDIDGPLTESAIYYEMENESPGREESLSHCDEAYYSAREDIAGHLFAFLKANRDKIRLH